MSNIFLIDDFDITAARILADEELLNCGLTKENVEITLKSFQGDEIAASVFLKKYALRDEENQIIEFTLDEARDRWATAIMEAENKFSGAKDIKYFRELYNYFLPGGRQMFGLGNKYLKKISLVNCYVTGIEEDSIEGIYDVGKRIARTYSYGGGIGFCIGNLRPQNAKVSNTARYSTGAVSFMELFSLTTGLIGQAGRRGALLLSIPVEHPDIESFIEIKHNNIDKVKHANISIKLSDAFMNAVIADQDFVLSFETTHETIRRVVKARDLWNKIVKSARDSAEPGLLFWDTMKKMSPSDIYEGLEVVSTNPCGEQILEKGGNCCLASLLLHKFVLNPYTASAKFDFETFTEMVYRSVRHLDDVVELNSGKHPLEEQNTASYKGRRIGLGLTGLADALLALNLKYDSEEALVFIDEIMRVKRDNEYTASIDLAKERGAFPMFDPQRHYNQGFCATLPEEIKKLGRQFGQRNVAISTVAPNGSLSIIAQSSSGIEPIFALSYKRYVEMGGKKRKEFTIFHPGLVRYFTVTGETTPNEKWVVAHQVDYTNRIKLQSVIQKYTDASISSTINLPKDVSEEVVSRIYIDAWANQLKGITVYREGSREGILITDEFEKFSIKPEMDTIIQCVRAEGGDKFYVMTSYKDQDIKKPYQIFVLNYKQTEKDTFIKVSNALIKMLKSNGVPDKRINKYIERSKNSLEKITRFLSLSMKTNNLDEAVQVLDEYAFAGTLVSRLYSILNKSLKASKSVCKKCGSSNVRMEEGCMVCLDCLTSGCG